MSDVDAAVAETRRWLQAFVIGQNLCPFAAAPYRHDRILYAVCAATDDESVYEAALQTLRDLVLAPARRYETALLIVSRGLGEFADYLDMLESIEHAIPEAGLEGVVQVASFHPDYRFADTTQDDPANYTNRSPYPMFHFILEQGLAAALASYPQPEQIPARNIRRLRALGISGIRALLARKP